ncbi:MAG: hypothetical protein M5R36_21105 [Deltaproteobacteria bacterium]|nr:hypothetical protein [Deltaproteobacteria bacterium]
MKSGFMLGLGERRVEIAELLTDIKAAGVRAVTIGQYLRPLGKRAPVARYLTPDEFDEIGDHARSMGFAYVASGPLVRSSYMAEELISVGHAS